LRSRSKLAGTYKAPIASPERIACTAPVRSSARLTIPSPGEAATCSTKAREVSERSASTTTTPRLRMTGWLKAAGSTTNANSGTPKIKINAARSCSSHRHSRTATSRNPDLAFAFIGRPLLPRMPVQIGAHAGAQLRHLLDGVGADREGPQVEIAGGACGA